MCAQTVIILHVGLGTYLIVGLYYNTHSLHRKKIFIAQPRYLFYDFLKMSYDFHFIG